MHRRRNEDSFSIFARQRKDRMTYMASGTLVKQAVITASWRNMDFLFTDHVVKFVRIDTGCIDHIFCLEHTLICVDFPDISRLFQIGYFCVKLKFHTIYIRILSQCDIQVERTHDPGAWRIQCCADIILKIRLHLMHFLFG